jgi:recombination protein RecA
MKLGSNEHQQVSVISTGCLELDIALGVGDAQGKNRRDFRTESSGKTTMTLHMLAQCQKAGGTAAFIDAEHALDPVYARKLGVDIDELYVSQPDTGEDALNIAEALVRSNAIDIIVIDSVAALVPKAEIEAIWAIPTSACSQDDVQALRKLAGIVNKTDCIIVFTTNCVKKSASCSAAPNHDGRAGAQILRDDSS